jgi:iron complex outermembrane receptor protein
MSGTIDGSVGKMAWHLDGNLRNAGDYKIPGNRVLGDPDSASGRLPHSDTRERNAGLGGSYVDSWGFVGASVSHLTNIYGIPSDEGSKIDQKQTRYDIDSLVKAPLQRALNPSSSRPATPTTSTPSWTTKTARKSSFKNRSLETRAELTHKPVAGWHGTFGVQTENTHFSALSAEGGPDTVPVTHSTSTAAFLVEEIDVGKVRFNAGARVERVKREPVTGVDRSFNLQSGSAGAMWAFVPGYGDGRHAVVCAARAVDGGAVLRWSARRHRDL